MIKTKELEDYLNFKREELCKTKEILNEYLLTKNKLIEQQDILELELVNNNSNIDSKLYSEQLDKCLLELLGLNNEILYTKELIENIEYDIEMCEKDLQAI